MVSLGLLLIEVETAIIVSAAWPQTAMFRHASIDRFSELAFVVLCSLSFRLLSFVCLFVSFLCLCLLSLVSSFACWVACLWSSLVCVVRVVCVLASSIPAPWQNKPLCPEIRSLVCTKFWPWSATTKFWRTTK